MPTGTMRSGLRCLLAFDCIVAFCVSSDRAYNDIQVPTASGLWAYPGRRGGSLRFVQGRGSSTETSGPPNLGKEPPAIRLPFLSCLPANLNEASPVVLCACAINTGGSSPI